MFIQHIYHSCFILSHLSFPSFEALNQPYQVTSITVNADPRDWRNALACVVQEAAVIIGFATKKTGDFQQIVDGQIDRYYMILSTIQKIFIYTKIVDFQ